MILFYSPLTYKLNLVHYKVRSYAWLTHAHNKTYLFYNSNHFIRRAFHHRFDPS